MESSLDDGYEDVNRDCDPDLRLDCVLGGTEEDLDSEVLFYPLEEKFDLPAHAIELGDGERREREVVREEDKSLGGLGIVELDSA